MSISGNLLDVSVADVMQFIHLGGRTGTLIIENEDERAEIGFHRGRIISSWTPTSQRLGDVLVESGRVDAEQLEQALARQEEEVPRVSLGKILVTTGLVSKEELREVVTRQIENTVYNLVAWKHGRFEFAMDELRPIDDIAVYPGDILPDINLNTQIVVLEALRIFDEKNRDRMSSKAGDEGASLSDGGDDSSRPERAECVLEAEGAFDIEALVEAAEQGDDREEVARSAGAMRLQVVCADFELLGFLKGLAQDDVSEVVGVRLWDAGLTLPGELPPITLIDMRFGAVTTEELASFRRARAHASILVVANDNAKPSDLFEAGALAVVPADPTAIAACVRSLVRSLSGPVSGGELVAAGPGFAKLRRVVADLRSGLLSATVALNLMKVISESVERAVMFRVRGAELVALGAFGFDEHDRPLAAVTGGLTLPMKRGNILVEAIETGQTRSVMFSDSGLPKRLVEIIGRPRTGQVVVFPVLGSDKVNAVVYTDNGQLSREIGEIEILELAAAQVGVAFENELLRRRMDQMVSVLP
jgi:hypothetical protein